MSIGLRPNNSATSFAAGGIATIVPGSRGSSGAGRSALISAERVTGAPQF